MQMYPRFAYHKELAPEGRLVPTAADEPTEEGWVETPAAFHPGYVKPAPVAGAEDVPEDAPPGFVPQPFPAYRYNQSGASQLVLDQAAADALDPEIWKETPDPDAWDPEKWAKKVAARAAGKANATAAPAAPAPAPAAAPQTPAPPAPSTPVASPEELAKLESQKEKAEQYALPVRAIEAMVKDSTNPETLAKIRQYEAANPNGTRKTVLDAVDARLKALAPTA